MVRAAARYGDASPGSGGLGVWYETKTATPVKGEETDFIATTPLPQPAVPVSKDSLLAHLSHLTVSMPTDSLKDLTQEQSRFPIRHGLLRKHPKLRMLTTHRDAHIYIFPYWILDFISENPGLESIGEDVIGWWAKATWQDGLAEKLGMTRILAAQHELSEDGVAPEYRAGDSSPTTDLPSPSRTSPPSDAKKAFSPTVAKTTRSAVPPVLAYIQPSQPDAQMIRRVDTAQLLLAVSLQIAKLPSIEEVGADASVFAHAKKVSYPEGVKPRTTVTKQDTLVAENVTVEEKTSIKECVVGANCQIREGARLFQCLLMDGVVVGKGCKLTRCILGKRSEIGEGSTLTNCEVQENLLVERRSKSRPLLFILHPQPQTNICTRSRGQGQ
jgi:translation initiation factor eIF-2B subunit gamma